MRVAIEEFQEKYLRSLEILKNRLVEFKKVKGRVRTCQDLHIDYTVAKKEFESMQGKTDSPKYNQAEAACNQARRIYEQEHKKLTDGLEDINKYPCRNFQREFCIIAAAQVKLFSSGMDAVSPLSEYTTDSSMKDVPPTSFPSYSSQEQLLSTENDSRSDERHLPLAGQNTLSSDLPTDKITASTSVSTNRNSETSAPPPIPPGKPLLVMEEGYVIEEVAPARKDSADGELVAADFVNRGEEVTAKFTPPPIPGKKPLLVMEDGYEIVEGEAEDDGEKPPIPAFNDLEEGLEDGSEGEWESGDIIEEEDVYSEENDEKIKPTEIMKEKEETKGSLLSSKLSDVSPLSATSDTVDNRNRSDEGVIANSSGGLPSTTGDKFTKSKRGAVILPSKNMAETQKPVFRAVPPPPTSKTASGSTENPGGPLRTDSAIQQRSSSSDKADSGGKDKPNTDTRNQPFAGIIVQQTPSASTSISEERNADMKNQLFQGHTLNQASLERKRNLRTFVAPITPFTNLPPMASEHAAGPGGSESNDNACEKKALFHIDIGGPSKATPTSSTPSTIYSTSSFPKASSTSSSTPTQVVNPSVNVAILGPGRRAPDPPSQAMGRSVPTPTTTGGHEIYHSSFSPERQANAAREDLLGNQPEEFMGTEEAVGEQMAMGETQEDEEGIEMPNSDDDDWQSGTTLTDDEAEAAIGDEGDVGLERQNTAKRNVLLKTCQDDLNERDKALYEQQAEKDDSYSSNEMGASENEGEGDWQADNYDEIL